MIDQICRLYQSHERVGVFGIGGTGKTTLAAALAYRLRNESHRPIVWLDVGPGDQTEILLESLARAVGGTTRKLPDPHHAAAYLRGLTEDLHMLVVFDDVKNDKMLCSLLDAVGPGNNVLLTGKNQGLSSLVQFDVHCLAIKPLDDETATTVLLDLAKVPSSSVLDRAPWQELVRSVGGLPLALVLLAGRLKLQHKNPMHLSFGASGIPTYGTAIKQTILETLNDTFKELESSHAASFIQLAVFDGSYFSLEAAVAIVRLNQSSFPEFIEVLQERMLVTITPDDILSLHPIVRTYAATKLAALPHEFEAANTRYLAFYANLLERHGGYEWNIASYPTLIRHETEAINAVRMSFEKWKGVDTLDNGEVCIRMSFLISWYLHWRGYWTLRCDICRRVIDQLEHSLHMDRLLAQNKNLLGNLCVDQGWVHVSRKELEEARKCAFKGVKLLNFSDGFFAEELAAQISLESGDANTACCTFQNIRCKLKQFSRHWLVISFRLVDALVKSNQQTKAETLLKQLVTSLSQTSLINGEAIDDVHASILYRRAKYGSILDDPKQLIELLQRALSLFEKAGMVNEERVATLFELSLRLRKVDSHQSTDLLYLALEYARTIGDNRWMKRIQAAFAEGVKSFNLIKRIDQIDWIDRLKSLEVWKDVQPRTVFPAAIYLLIIATYTWVWPFRCCVQGKRLKCFFHLIDT